MYPRESWLKLLQENSLQRGGGYSSMDPIMKNMN
jgi:hypothetical protein